jgi:hypothetical protein
MSPDLAARFTKLALHAAVASALGCWTLSALADMDASTVDLPFAGFFKRPVGPRGLELTPQILAADGHRVRLVGYMVAREQPTSGRFLFTPRPVRLSEEADGEADDLPPATVLVLLDPTQSDRVVAHQLGTLAITGRLELGRLESPGQRVSWFRLHLDPDAVAVEPLGPGAPTELSPTPARRAFP